MRVQFPKAGVPFVLAMAALAAGPAVQAQPVDPSITVDGERPPSADAMTPGPDVKGIISARTGDKIQVSTADGQRQVVTLAEATQVKAGGGLFGSKQKFTTASLVTGLPVTVKTRQWTGGLVASQVTFRNGDMKTASMIHNGTNQRFEEQTAATEALRGRLGDIDKYNLKSTTNVYFDTGRYNLSPEAKASLCSAAAQAEQTDNALMLVVGYTDSVGGDEYNQTLSDKRAGTVMNYLQQACRWKPYRMLTPTGMAKADPAASNDTPEGKAQNRRVSVNVLVSKSVDGM